MKSTILFIVTFLILASCKNETFQQNENISFEDSVCKVTLEGFAEFKINKTTVSDIRKVFNKSQESAPHYIRPKLEPIFDEGLVSYDSDSLILLIKNKTKIRQYEIPGLYGQYMVGNIKIEKLYLLCNNDTLIGVLLEYVPDLIKDAFIKKYGEGFGSYINNTFIDLKDSKNNNVDVSEHRFWVSNEIKAEYSYCVCTQGCYDNELKIYDNKKFNKAINRIKYLNGLLDNENKHKIKKSLELI